MLVRIDSLTVLYSNNYSNSLIWICYTWCSLSTVEGHLSCFSFGLFQIMIPETFLYQWCVHLSALPLSVYTGQELLSHGIYSFFVVTVKKFFQSDYMNLHSHRQFMRFIRFLADTNCRLSCFSHLEGTWWGLFVVLYIIFLSLLFPWWLRWSIFSNVC